MAAAALVIAIIAFIFAIAPPLIPYQVFQSFGQIIGTTLGLAALALGVMARRRASRQQQPTRVASSSVAVGALSVVLGLSVFFFGLYTMKKVGSEIEKGGGSFKSKFQQAFFKEFGRELDHKGKPEFRKAMKKAVRNGTRARLRSEKAGAPKKGAAKKK